MSECICVKLYTQCPQCGLTYDMWPPNKVVDISDCATLQQLQRRMKLFPTATSVKVDSSTYQYKYNSLESVPGACKALYDKHGHFVCGLS